MTRNLFFLQLKTPLSLCIFEIADDAGGISGDNGFCRYIFGDDAPRAYYRPAPDGDTRQDYHIGRNPHIIFDYHRQGAHDSLVALFCIVVVYDGADGGVWSDKYIVADGYIGFIEDCEIEVACKILSDMDVEAEIAVKRRVDDKALTDTADYLVQQVGALFAA